MMRKTLALVCLLVLGSGPNIYAEDGKTYEARDADWRNGALVYQVIVDRFAPADDLEAKRHLYPAPKRLREWGEAPTRGTYVEEAGVWSHEIDFWGGDLDSLRGRMGYIHELGVDVLYLNPIHQAYTNHKYDAQDYFAVSEEYGTREDVEDLAREVHARGMRLVLDGVLNHMGRTSPWFQDAMANPRSPYRDYFIIGDQFQHGYQAWVNVKNLPELNLENRALRRRLWLDRDSVVQGYLRDGVDGWRLDVAFDIGYEYLDELTRSAHRARPGSLVIGEIWNYPEKWFPAVDGLMNMAQREVMLAMIQGRVEPDQAARLIDVMVEDAGIEPLLKSWVMIDNHDTQRLRTVLRDPWQQRMAQVLQFTLPGSPCIYYGVEVGMEGGDDPEQRGPMRWDLVTEDNEHLQWMRRLIALRQDNRALRIGDYRSLPTTNIFAFMRNTERAGETILVVANPTSEERREFLLPRESSWMSFSVLVDQLTGHEVTTHAGTLTVTLPPHTIRVYKVRIPDGTVQYSPYKRVP